MDKKEKTNPLMLYSSVYYERKSAFDKVPSWCTLSVMPATHDRAVCFCESAREKVFF